MWCRFGVRNCVCAWFGLMCTALDIRASNVMAELEKEHRAMLAQRRAKFPNISIGDAVEVKVCGGASPSSLSAASVALVLLPVLMVPVAVL